MMGPEAVEKIRALGYDGPILGVTGNTLPEQVADFVQHGVDEVIAKPVKANVIKEVLYKRLSDPRFPVAATGGTGGPATATATTAAAAPVAAGNHVLVVEDSPVARTMLVRLLKSLGYTADEAEDGQQAVDKVRPCVYNYPPSNPIPIYYNPYLIHSLSDPRCGRRSWTLMRACTT